MGGGDDGGAELGAEETENLSSVLCPEPHGDQREHKGQAATLGVLSPCLYFSAERDLGPPGRRVSVASPERQLRALPSIPIQILPG